jgi:hypothetical protein
MSIIAGQGEGGCRTVLDTLPVVFPIETALPHALLVCLVQPSATATAVITLTFVSMTPLALWLHALRLQQAPPLLQYVARTATFLAWSALGVPSSQWIAGGAAAVAAVAMVLLERAPRGADKSENGEPVVGSPRHDNNNNDREKRSHR